MLDHCQFNDRLVEELRTHRIFEMFDDKPIANCVPERVNLQRQSSEGLTFYRVAQQFVLEPRETADRLLSDTRARCKILFTSTEPHFDFAQAVDARSTPPGGHISSVNVVMQIFGPERYCLAEWRKTLWSADPGHVEGEPEFVKLLA